MEQICPSCGEKLKLIPAGTSKTKVDANGEYIKYKAFYSCPNRCKIDVPVDVHVIDTGKEIIADRVTDCEERIKKLEEIVQP